MAFDPTKFGEKVEEFDPSQLGEQISAPSNQSNLDQDEGILGHIRHALDYPASFAAGFLTPVARGAQNILKSADAWRQLIQGVPVSQIDTSGVEFLKPGQNLQEKTMPWAQSPGQQFLSGIGENTGELAYLLEGGSGPTALSRILGSGATSGLTSDSPMLGAAIGGAGAGVGEMLPGVIKGVGKISKSLDIEPYAKQLIKKLHTGYQGAKNQASSLYNDVLSRIGHETVTPNPADFHGINSVDKKMLSSESKRILDKFENEPSFENSHRLQSAMFKDANRAASSQNYEKSFEIDNLRDSLKDNINDWLSENYPYAVQPYRQASKITREYIKPFEMEKTLNSIAEGTSGPQDIPSSELALAFKSFRKNPKIDKYIKSNHPIRESENLLKSETSKINKRQLIADALGSLAGGALVGGHGMGVEGILPAAGGAGWLTHRYLKPLTDLGLSAAPRLSAMQPGYNKAYQTLLSLALSQLNRKKEQD